MNKKKSMSIPGPEPSEILETKACLDAKKIRFEINKFLLPNSMEGEFGIIRQIHLPLNNSLRNSSLSIKDGSFQSTGCLVGASKPPSFSENISDIGV